MLHNMSRFPRASPMVEQYIGWLFYLDFDFNQSFVFSCQRFLMLSPWAEWLNLYSF